jgi:CubicO group peptidase (beta-lactamase class C family)
MDIRRDIHNAASERRLNVVLVSVESLSAFYSGTYGASPSLTPELDRIAGDSLVFTDLYASGTRTVRGLEALALSVPPTPGESIVKRPGNIGLFTMASDLAKYARMIINGGSPIFKPETIRAMTSGVSPANVAVKRGGGYASLADKVTLIRHAASIKRRMRGRMPQILIP